MESTVKRRSALLIEVLVALTLISLCLLPLFSSQLKVRQKRREELAKIQLARLSRTVLATLKERIYAQTYSWQTLREGIQCEEPAVAVLIGKNKNVPYDCTLSLQEVEHCTRRQSGKCHLLLDATITFTRGNERFTITYPLLINKIGPGDVDAL